MDIDQDKHARELQSDKERREYFRIEDEVTLVYRPIDQDEVPALKRKIEIQNPDKFTIAASFIASTRRMNRMLDGVSLRNGELAGYLKSLDEKLNLLARLFVADEVDVEHRPKNKVSLSAGGLAFSTGRELQVGQLLEVRLVLHPSMIGVLAVGEVVQSVEEIGEIDAPSWQVSISYAHIRENDRDLLCRHIIQRETDQRRRQRQDDP